METSGNLIEQCQNSAKQGQTGPNRAKQCQNSAKTVCSDTPRFSYRPSETVICACPGGPVDAGSAINGAVRVGVPGWVYRVGVPGWVYRGSTTQLPGEDP